MAALAWLLLAGSTVFMIYIGSASINNLLCRKTIINVIRYTAIVSILLYWIANIGSLLCVINILIGLTSSWIEPIGVISFWMWLSAHNAMSSVFVLLLKHSFKDTKYSYHKYLFITFYIFLFLHQMLLTIIIIGRLTIYFVTSSNDEYPLHVMGRSIFVLFLTLFHTIFSIILLCLFQHKLVQLMKSYFISFRNFKQNQEMESIPNINDDDILEIEIKENTYSLISGPSDSPKIAKQNNHKNSNKNVKKNNKNKNKHNKNRKKQKCVLKVISDSIQNKDDNILITNIEHDTENKVNQHIEDKKMELIHSVTKYTILVSLSVITSLFVNCNIIINGIETVYIKRFFYYQLMINTDSFIISLCLFLHFPFSSSLYECICFYPHRLFAHCFGKIMRFE